jgi:hypothetical protein
MAGTMIRFECGQEDRISDEFGPFDFVQLTYNTLRVSPNGDELAHYADTPNEWRLWEHADQNWYSDVIIYDAGEG